ncbi:unnamed protein product [Mortierella alpina]
MTLVEAGSGARRGTVGWLLCCDIKDEMDLSSNHVLLPCISPTQIGGSCASKPSPDLKNVVEKVRANILPRCPSFGSRPRGDGPAAYDETEIYEKTTS